MMLIRLLLNTFPFLICLITLFLGSTLRIGGYPLLPAFFLIPIYYWLVYCPNWLPLWALFALGLFYDSLMGNDLGITSLLLMGSSLIGYFVRPHLNPHQFSQVWGSFAVYCVCYLTLYGLLFSGGIALLFSGLYSLLLFPLFVWGLGVIHQRLQVYV